jgi:hypothetical protein
MTRRPILDVKQSQRGAIPGETPNRVTADASTRDRRRLDEASCIPGIRSDIRMLEVVAAQSEQRARPSAYPADYFSRLLLSETIIPPVTACVHPGLPKLGRGVGQRVFPGLGLPGRYRQISQVRSYASNRGNGAAKFRYGIRPDARECWNARSDVLHAGNGFVSSLGKLRQGRGQFWNHFLSLLLKYWSRTERRS